MHGALTDGSVWGGVASRLLRAGHRVVVPALPMRGLESDAAYLDGVLSQVDGPIVLVAHSYAGAVISHPRSIASSSKSTSSSVSADVRALVFVAAFQPDSGEAAGELNGRFPGTGLVPENLVAVPNALGGSDLTLRPEAFAPVYAADVEPEHAAVLAVSQRPIEPNALGETFDEPPTWRSIPSWALITTADRSLPPAVLRFMAERAGSQTAEVEASHAVPISQPDAVAALIATAIESVAAPVAR